MRRLAPLVLLSLIACSAATLYVRQQSDMLYFGMKKAHGGVVSDAEWEQFLREVVTPRFPGFTHWKAQGEWMNQGEETRVLVIVHGLGDERAIRDIVAEGERRLDQQEVFQVRSDVWLPASELRTK